MNNLRRVAIYHPLAMRLWDPLAVREFTALVRDPVLRGRGVPKGDGRPVLLLPGFFSGDLALQFLHNWLSRVGYKSHLSGILLNVQHVERVLPELNRKIAAIQKDSGMRVSLVGHSLGGLMAKVLSQRKPDRIEQVIALGSPLANWGDVRLLTQRAVSAVKAGNELIYGRRLAAEGRFTYDLLSEPRVPVTSIYTPTDDVVNFRSCLRPDIPALPVWGSHNGLIVNPEVYRLLGRLLARPHR